MRPDFASIGTDTIEPQASRPSFDSIQRPIYDLGIIDRDERIQQFMSNTQDIDDETRARLVNSLYLADTYKVPFEQAYQNHDGAISELFGRSTSAQAALKQIQDRNKTSAERFNDYDDGYYDKARATGAGKIESGIFSLISKAGDRYNRMGVNLTQELIGLVEATGDITFSETLQDWSEMMRGGVQMYMEENPAEFLNPGGDGFWDTTWAYVSNPEYILLGVMEQVPNIALSYVGGVAGKAIAGAAGAGAAGISKAKWLGGIEGFAVPSFGRRYSNLRGDGISPLLALPEAFLGSQAEGLLEHWTLGKKIQIFKNAGQAVERSMGTVVARTLLGGAKAYGRGMFEEGTQQVSDNFLAILFRDADIGLLNDVGNQVAAGGLLEMVMAGGFQVAGSFTGQVGKETQLQRLETFRDKIIETPLNQVHRQEINKEIDELVESVEAEVVAAPPVAEVPAEAVEVPVEPVKAVEPKVTVEKIGEKEFFHAERVTGDIKEGKVLGIFLTKDRIVAQGFAGAKGEISKVKATFNKPLIIESVNKEFPEAFTPEEFLGAIQKAGVDYDADIDGDTFSEILDDAGLPFIKAIKKAGFDALIFPDIQGNRSFDTTLVFDKKQIQARPAAEVPVEPVKAVEPDVVEIEARQPPKDLIEEIDRTQRYGIQETESGWAVKDWETEENVSTHGTDRQAIVEMNKLNKVPPPQIMGGIIFERVEPNLYIGNVTRKMKKKFAEIFNRLPEDVKGFTEEGFPTKRTKIEMTRGEATAYLNFLVEDLDARFAANKIKTENDLAQANADWGDIAALREVLGHSKGARPFKVIRAEKQKMVIIKNTKSRIWAAIKGVEDTVTIRKALQAVMEGMSKAAAKGYMQGARDMIALHKNLNKYAREQLKGLDMQKPQMTKLMTAIASAKNESERIAAHALIDILADQSRRTKAMTVLKKIITLINLRIGKPQSEGGIAPDYLSRIKAVTDTFVTKKKLTPKQKNRARGLASYLEKIKHGESQTYSERYAEERIPKELIAQVDQLAIKNITDMTVKELDDINQTLRLLLHLNKTKNAIINRRTGERVAEGLNSAVEEAVKLKNRSSLTDRDTVSLADRPDRGTDIAGWLKDISRNVFNFFAGNKNHDIETLTETITGGIKGATYDILVNGISDGRERQNQFLSEWDKIADKHLKDIPLEDLQELSNLFFQFIKNPIIRETLAKNVNLKQTPQYDTFKDRNGKTIRMTMAQMMSVYMMSENMDTVSEMIKAGVASPGNRLGAIVFDNIVAVRTQVEANPLAMKLIEMGKEIKRFEASQINEISRGLDGIDIAAIVAYWHRERFTGGGVAGHQAFRNSLLESMGWLQEREGSGNPVIIRDFFETLTSDSQAISEYVGMAAPYRNIKNLLNYKEYRDVLQSKGYGEELSLIDAMIERTEQKPKEFSVIDNAVSKIMRGLIRSVLANPGIMAGQIASIIPVLENEMSLKYASSMNLSMNKAYIDRLKEHWFTYRQRLEGLVSSIALQEIGLSDLALRKFTDKQDYINYLTRGIHYVDSVAITAIGRTIEVEMADSQRDGISAEYWDNQGIDPSAIEKDSTEYWDAFVKRANYVLRRTQPMFNTENRSILTSETSITAKSLFLFRSYIDQPLRMAHRSMNDYNNGRINAATAAKRMATLWAGLATYEIIRAAVRKGLFRSDEDEKDLLLSILFAPIKTINIIGYPSQKIITEVVDFKMTGDPIDLRFTDLSPLPLQFANDAIRHTGNLARGIGYIGTNIKFQSGKYKGKLKSDIYLRKGFYGIFSDTLRYYGVPIRQIELLVKEKEAKKKGFL